MSTEVTGPLGLEDETRDSDAEMLLDSTNDTPKDVQMIGEEEDEVNDVSIDDDEDDILEIDEEVEDNETEEGREDPTEVHDDTVEAEKAADDTEEETDKTSTQQAEQVKEALNTENEDTNTGEEAFVTTDEPSEAPEVVEVSTDILQESNDSNSPETPEVEESTAFVEEEENVLELEEEPENAPAEEEQDKEQNDAIGTSPVLDENSIVEEGDIADKPAELAEDPTEIVKQETSESEEHQKEVTSEPVVKFELPIPEKHLEPPLVVPVKDGGIPIILETSQSRCFLTQPSESILKDIGDTLPILYREQSDTLVDETLGSIFHLIRETDLLKDDFDAKMELVLSVEQLGLSIQEDNYYSSKVTLLDLVHLKVKYNHKEDLDVTFENLDSVALTLKLSTQDRFITQFNLLCSEEVDSTELGSKEPDDLEEEYVTAIAEEQEEEEEDILDETDDESYANNHKRVLEEEDDQEEAREAKKSKI